MRARLAAAIAALAAVACGACEGSRALVEEEDGSRELLEAITRGQPRRSARDETRPARRRKATESASEAERLNVLFIVVDDMRVESKLYDRPWNLMPNVDAWAQAKGAQQFDYAYTTEPLCGPSRASFMSARTTMSLEFHTNTGTSREAEVLFDSNSLLMTDWFNDNSFDVSGVSKIYHYIQSNDEAFDQADASSYQSEPSKLVTNACSGGLRCGVSNSTDLVDKESTSWAIDRLEALKDTTTPFFMAVGMHRPHLPFRVPQAHIDRVVRLTGLDASAADEVDLHQPGAPASFYEIPGDSVPAEAYSYCPNLEGYSDWDEDADMVDYTSLGYYAAISYIDEEIGLILSKLDEVGLADNTIVSVFSDHGWSLGEHGAWCKRSEYDLVTRVPLWIHDPRATATEALSYNRRSFMSLVDLYPTIADLAGIPLSVTEYGSYNIDGVSRAPNFFRDTISNATTEVLQRIASAEGHSFGYPSECAFTVQPACFDSNGDKSACDTVLTFDSMGISVRTENYRYTEWWPWDDSTDDIDFAGGLPTGKAELYDQTTDSYELVNLAENSTYSDIVTKHKAYLRAYFLDCTSLVSGSECDAEAHCMSVDDICYLRSDCSVYDGQDAACEATGFCAARDGLCYDTMRTDALTTASPTTAPTPAPTTLRPTSAPTTRAPTSEGETLSPTPSSTTPDNETSGGNIVPSPAFALTASAAQVAVAVVCALAFSSA